MNELDERDRKALERARLALAECHGKALRAVALVGEAASPDYRPRRSPLTVAAVIDEVTPEALRRTRPALRGWRRRLRTEAPLLFDPLYLETARDVFPVELLDMGDRHVVISGEDPFADPPIDPGHLRLEVEEQLRGKMLHLWHCTLAATSRRLRRALLAETISAFGPLFRGLLFLRGAPRPQAAGELLDTVERTYEIELSAMREITAAAARGRRLPGDQIEKLLDRYLTEVRSLVRLVDQL